MFLKYININAYNHISIMSRGSGAHCILGSKTWLKLFPHQRMSLDVKAIRGDQKIHIKMGENKIKTEYQQNISATDLKLIKLLIRNLIESSPVQKNKITF